MTALRTARLTLTPIGLDDAAFLLGLLNDPGWIANIGDRGVRDLEGARAYITDRLAGGTWFVARTSDEADGDAAVGVAGIVPTREGMDCPDLGYAILEAHAGKGYATEAAAAVLAYARSDMGLPRIAAITDPNNRASRHVLEKIGLSFEKLIDLPSYPDEPSAYYA
ncbi:GNAT family N-acetyltransferase [Phenylobacterium sp.]|jgi:ribosomal-protein-alanine N-acetyltransferase|uniref:GNAT family N-acetyltransferase n=1 Tax=Phenylobacterium sp. TaxID=1871053 RepID=UPI003784EF5A